MRDVLEFRSWQSLIHLSWMCLFSVPVRDKLSCPWGRAVGATGL